MISMKRLLFHLLHAALVLAIIQPLSSCQRNYHSVTCMEDLDHARIGVITGTAEDFLISEMFHPEQVFRFDNNFIIPLQQRKVDVIVDETKILPGIGVVCPEMKHFPFTGGNTFDIAFAVRLDNETLCRQLSAFIDSLKATGVTDSLVRRWETREGALGEVECYRSKATGEPLKIAVPGDIPPYNYIVNNENSGMEIELLEMFAESIGRTTSYSVMNFNSVPTDVAMKRSDIGAGMLTITEEHARKVLFTSPYKVTESVAFYLPEEYLDSLARIGTFGGDFFGRVSDSFHNNLVVENRYMLIVKGLAVTLCLSFFSILLGTILGGGLCWMRMHRRRLLRRSAGCYIRIMRGTPILVLLLILYYVVFGTMGTDGMVVACVAFALNMAAYVCEIFRSGIGSVDRGQQEAGMTLGFSKEKAFRLIVLPQAMKHALPVYINQVVNVILETSIVGYVAVVDMTKASDIIRSRTYDAFFPLLFSAVLYFLITWLATCIISNLAEHTLQRPKKAVKRVWADSKAGGKPCRTEIGKSDVLIRVNHLSKIYENRLQVLKDVNAQIRRGEVISIIGPSGTGKSTFLRCLNRLESPTSGIIQIDGQDIAARGADLTSLRRRMGMVFQSFNLFEHLSVLDNITLAPTRLLGLDAGQAEEKAMELLNLVGLADKAGAFPKELSGGQKQRIAIARALAMEPEILLFDEPTSALDPTMVSEVLNVIHKLAAEGITMLIVTHEMRFARSISTRIFYMDEGVIYEDGTPGQIFDNPYKEKTRSFINRVRKSEVHITSRYYDHYGIISQFENFCSGYSLSRKMKDNVQHCVEELLTIVMSDKPDITMVLSYSEAEDNLTFTLNSSNAIDPEMFSREENSICAAMLKGISRGMEMSEKSITIRL